jgi:hypothetical protein
MLPDRRDDHCVSSSEARPETVIAPMTPTSATRMGTAAMFGIVQRVETEIGAQDRAFGGEPEARPKRGLMASQRQVALASSPVVVVRGAARQGRMEQGPIGCADIDDHRGDRAPRGGNQRRADLPCGLLGEAGKTTVLSCSSKSSSEGALAIGSLRKTRLGTGCTGAELSANVVDPEAARDLPLRDRVEWLLPVRLKASGFSALPSLPTAPRASVGLRSGRRPRRRSARPPRPPRSRPPSPAAGEPASRPWLVCALGPAAALRRGPSALHKRRA